MFPYRNTVSSRVWYSLDIDLSIVFGHREFRLDEPCFEQVLNKRSIKATFWQRLTT